MRLSQAQRKCYCNKERGAAIFCDTRAEVIFHRFFQKLVPAELRQRYRGKQDLDSRDLEPNLGSLLAEIQGVLNGDLQQRNPSFHFDYIDATEPNALAFEDEGFAFVAITMPLIRELFWKAERLSKDPRVIEVLKVTSTKTEPWAIQVFLFATQLSFVVAHEYSHHDRGHILPSTQLRLELPSDGTGSLRRQAQEVDADGLAVYLVLSHLFTGARRDSTRKLLVLDCTDAEFEEMLLASGNIFREELTCLPSSSAARPSLAAVESTSKKNLRLRDSCE